MVVKAEIMITVSQAERREPSMMVVMVMVMVMKAQYFWEKSVL